MKTPVYIKTTEDKISLPGEEGNNFPPSIKLLNALPQSYNGEGRSMSLSQRRVTW